MPKKKNNLKSLWVKGGTRTIRKYSELNDRKNMHIKTGGRQLKGFLEGASQLLRVSWRRRKT